MGVGGGATALLIYYGLGTLAFAFYLWSGRSVVTPKLLETRLRWPLFRDILRIGLLASLTSIMTNLTIALTTGVVGAFGPAAIAGYGVGTRLEYMLIPLAFGFGGPLVALVGTNMGAGNRERALRAAWIGGWICFALTEAIGVAAALFPAAWLTLFDRDPAMIAAGSAYLRIVGPFYGFFGLGMALYFASQGAGALKWPLHRRRVASRHRGRRRLCAAALDRKSRAGLCGARRRSRGARPDDRRRGVEWRVVQRSQ